MIDPREAKLPKWAQDVLATERKRAALAWPTEARPDPLWQPGVNTYAPHDMNGTTVWQSIPVHSEPRECVAKSGFVHGPGDGSTRLIGSRPEDGRFFATRREALLDMLWARSEEAAARLYALQDAIAKDDGE